MRQKITAIAPRPRRPIKPGDPSPYESAQTRRISRSSTQDGNAVSNTYTLNFGYGVGLVADGTGILLNNELDDFSAKPGVPNAYGLVGGDANAVAAGQAAALLDDADHRAQGRQAVPGHRQPGRQRGSSRRCCR